MSRNKSSFLASVSHAVTAVKSMPWENAVFISSLTREGWETRALVEHAQAMGFTPHKSTNVQLSTQVYTITKSLFSYLWTLHQYGLPVAREASPN